MAAGAGKPGYCSICVSPNYKAYNKAIESGANATHLNDLADTYGERWNRQTWYSHKEHALSPEKRVVQAAERERKALVVKKNSNTDVLEAIRDIGMARAQADPESVTVDQALKAVQILEGRKNQSNDLNVLIAFITGHAPPTVIEGEAREVSAE